MSLGRRQFLALVLTASAGLGLTWALRADLRRLVVRLRRRGAQPPPPPAYFSDITGRRELSCASLQGTGTCVILAAGQSNAANHGAVRYVPRGPVVNFFNGRCFAAQDPLLGAMGDGGSVWTRLADKVIDRGLCNRVVIACPAVEASAIERWAPGGDLHRSLLDATEGLIAAGLPPTHFLWHQGEAEVAYGTTARRYRAAFLSMLGALRYAGLDCPVYVATATRLGSLVNDVIQGAQRSLPNPAENIFPGPDTDTILSRAPGGAHLDERGLDEHAEAWLRAITER